MHACSIAVLNTESMWLVLLWIAAASCLERDEFKYTYRPLKHSQKYLCSQARVRPMTKGLSLCQLETNVLLALGHYADGQLVC